MLTKFHSTSSFKKKFTVIMIWLLSFVMMFTMGKFLIESKVNLLWFVFPLIFSLFVISGILLRCKIARWFTLLIIYTVALIPFLAYFVSGVILPSESILLYTFITFLLLYVFSNEKAMDLFYIESYPLEHLPLLIVALFLHLAYRATSNFIQ